jgi:hypothetical protein
MRHCLNFLLALSSVLTQSSCGKSLPSKSEFSLKSPSAGIVSPSISPDLSDKYTISSTLEILKPVNVGSMTNDAQKTEVISENALTIKVKITVDPTKDQLSELKPNSYWKADYSQNSDLQKYLTPGITTNWDEEMKSELLAALSKAGINPDKLSDVELVKKISQWIFRSPEFQYQDHFVSYDVEFINGTIQIIPDLKKHFESQREKNHFSSDNEALSQGIFGKSMFRARKYGNCTYSATLQATILKALGIPTRLVVMVPAVDWNDQAQWNMIRDNIHQNAVRSKVQQGLALQPVGSWGSHTFNEVYVGNTWVRLNYANLGQTPADPQFFGLMLQVNQVADWSEANLGRTWGIHAQSHNLVSLSSNNTFRSSGISDRSDILNSSNNPPALAELVSIKLEKSFNSDETSLPDAVKNNLKADPSFAVTVQTSLDSFQYTDLAVFRRKVSRRFILRGPGVPDVIVYESGSWFKPGFTALKFKPQDMNQLSAGVEYKLVPESTSGPYQWEIGASLKFKKPEAPPTDA